MSVLLDTQGSPLPAALFVGGGTLYLAITVNGEPLEPRQQIGSVPYASRAAGAVNANSPGGLSAGEYPQAVHSHDLSSLSEQVSDGQIMSVNAPKVTGPIDAATLTGRLRRPSPAPREWTGTCATARIPWRPASASRPSARSGADSALEVPSPRPTWAPCSRAGGLPPARPGHLSFTWAWRSAHTRPTPGGGANLLCLSEAPTWDALNDFAQGGAHLYRVE